MAAITLGFPRLHLRLVDSTNRVARELAAAGAPHGTLVTAAEQTAGRGRQGRRWDAPADAALLMSLVVRAPPPLLSLRAGIAVAQIAQRCDPRRRRALVKWPNDVWLDGAKLAGILVEARPQAGWAVLGIGVNVAVDLGVLAPETAAGAATLGLRARDVDAVRAGLLEALERRLADPPAAVLAALRERDALRGAAVRWAGGSGEGAGIDDGGRLLVRRHAGELVALDAGEVHLERP